MLLSHCVVLGKNARGKSRKARTEYTASNPTKLQVTAGHGQVESPVGSPLAWVDFGGLSGRSVHGQYLTPSSHFVASRHPSIKMTRSHKYNDRDHKGIADGSVSPTENLPRFFAKSGYVDVDPKKVKKDGCGKGNWGSAGEEVVDEGFRFTNARRRSNSFSHQHLSDFKTKFEVNEVDPLFEEHLHGPLDEENGDDLSKTDSAESVHSV
ncbi:hypothetical protein TsFJ059_002693 [Trichoderma semiorbis]|uniref:STF2-like protein n=1 Tax=Trichoderma semiorbis TaxID=1491008 RepID=A0A9P8HM33_9HYPO|nr:hypothetical protein TsFJ059_002693 [Trichoderma semiorbis]